MKKSNIAKIALVFILIGPMYAGPVKWAKSKVLHKKSYSAAKSLRANGLSYIHERGPGKGERLGERLTAYSAKSAKPIRLREKLKKKSSIKRAAGWVKSKILHRKSYALPKELSPNLETTKL